MVKPKHLTIDTAMLAIEYLLEGEGDGDLINCMQCYILVKFSTLIFKLT